MRPGIANALRHLGAACLFLLAFLTAAGAVTGFRHPDPKGSPADWIVPAVVAALSAAGGGHLYRRAAGSFRDLPKRPAFQGIILYAAAFFLMLLLPRLSHGIAFLAFLAFSVVAPLSPLAGARWLPGAASAVLGEIVLFAALNETAERASGHSLREGSMIYLLPLQAFLILLAVSGIIRWRRRRRKAPVPGDAPPIGRTNPS